MAECFECKQPATHWHHVVPRVLGGTQTIPLCDACHGKVHGLDLLNHRTLTKRGLAEVRAQGRKLGRPNMVELGAGDTVKLVHQLYASGKFTHRTLADELNARGVPTATGTGRWWPKTVRAALLLPVPADAS